MSSDDEKTLRIDDEALAQGFTMIPNVILKNPDLSRDAKLLYAVLLSYAWQDEQCFPGYDTLQSDLGCGRTQVSKYLRELSTAGVLDVKRRGQGKTSIYTLKIRVGMLKSQNGTTRSVDLKLQEVPKPAGEEDSVKKDSEDEDIDGDDSNIRMTLIDYVEDFAREFRDTAPLKSSVTRAANLYASSGLSLKAFIEAMYTAREKTKYATKVKNRMSYFFTVLEQLVAGQE